MNSIILIAALIVGTWNGNWFPSGRAEHRAHPDVEDATITAAAKMLASGLRTIDPHGKDDVILCLNEMRGPKAVSNLVARIERAGLRVVVISGYRRRDRFDTQQDAIATTLPVGHCEWQKYQFAGSETPPRGYAFAAVEIQPAVTAAVYATHLKSNYRANTPQASALNRAKRTRSMAQILKDESGTRSWCRCALVAGDFNADPWRSEFAAETLFETLGQAGFVNLLQLLPSNRRGTHPSRTYGDSALDFIMARSFKPLSLPIIVPSEELSDHWAVFARLEFEKGVTVR